MRRVWLPLLLLGLASCSTLAGADDEGGADESAAIEACVEEGALARPLAITDEANASVWIHEPGAEPRALAVPGQAPDGGVQIVVAASPSAIAVASNYSYMGADGVEEGSTLRLFDRDGEAPSWEQDFPDHRFFATWLEDSTLVAQAGTGSDQSFYGVVRAGGEHFELASYRPWGPVDAEGWIPVHTLEAGLVTGSGFYDPSVDSFIDLPEATTAGGQWWYARDGEIEYISSAGDARTMVIADPAGTRSVELPEIAGLTPQVQSVAGDYRLIAGLSDDPNVAPVMIRVDVEAAEVIPAEPALPAGLEAFDCYDAVRYVDLGGRVIFELRDEGTAYLQAWDPGEGSWSPLGRPLAAVEDLELTARFGRVHVIQAYALGSTFCPPVDWPGAPAEEALLGTSVQLIRAEPALELVAGTELASSVQVDEAERCAAWPSASGFALTDLDDLETLELGAGDRLIWLE